MHFLAQSGDIKLSVHCDDFHVVADLEKWSGVRHLREKEYHSTV